MRIYSMGMIEEYFEYQKKMEDKYGDNSVVLMQVGGFYEVYSFGDPIQGKAKDVARVCNMVLSSKNKNVPNGPANPNMCGMPTQSVKRYVEILVNANYTVVVIEQELDNPQVRKITEVHSPGTHISETSDSNTIACVYEDGVNAAVCWIHVTTGRVSVQEIYGDNRRFMNEEIFRIVTSSGSKETIICSKGSRSKDVNVCGYKHVIEYNNVYGNVTYQNESIGRVYGHHMIAPIESINMEMHSMGIIPLVILIEFCEDHHSSLLTHIQKPVVETNDHMVLHNTTMYQLQMINTDVGLYDIINKTSTCMGKRLLWKTMMNPSNNVEYINASYEDIESITPHLDILLSHLKRVGDIDRFLRQVANKTIRMNDIIQLIHSLKHANDVLEVVANKVSFNIHTHQLKSHYESMIRTINISSDGGVFVRGVYIDVDKSSDRIELYIEQLKNICKRFSKLIGKHEDTVKLDIGKDTYIVHTTPSRATELKKHASTKVFFTKENKQRIVISTEEINTLIHKLVKEKEENQQLVHERCAMFVNGLFDVCDDLRIVSTCIARVDMLASYATIAQMYNYTKPIAIPSEKAYIVATNMRHPIVEQLDNDTMYTGNNINLKDKRAMLLYGVNGSGKSCFSKSIGLCLVMAQMGMFVPASTFEFSPYDRIFTRISSDDNIYRGLSSFFVEMTELKSILDHANARTLVIGDEVCKGTEDISAMSIVATTCHMLSRAHTNFVFATHLHGLPKLDAIKSIIESSIQINHIGVSMSDGNIVFDRVLRDGQGDHLYGLEIANYILENKGFAQIALTTRKEIMKKHPKTSKYNTTVIVSACEVCDSTNNLETHHITFQKNAHKHIKDKKGNLVVLCKICHDRVHIKKDIAIDGWKQTSNGKKLMFTQLL
jgi:DNA mismatch repair protein MutS